ncbi:serine hydrolase [Aquincola sp. MAHUQ-54]|uniref:beta-lactamase n=1 Tax=Aquincola agrisoli TaxID=3119538 RepID=A0AAW9QKX7_9BURK
MHRRFAPFAARRFVRSLARSALGALPAVVVLMMAAAPRAGAAPAPGWTQRLQAELQRIERQLEGSRRSAGVGVYVRDLSSGASVSLHGQEPWYLASTVKVPVAIAVLRGVERGDYTLETTLTLRAGDYVDGAGATNRHAAGEALTIRYLLEQMIVYSDNTASDMLIGLVGIREVNALVASLVPKGFERITSLADVRRQAYGQLDPGAAHLSGHDFLVLKAQRTDADRMKTLALLLQVPASGFRLRSLGEAYDAYYASGLNSGRLDAYGELLALLVEGKALGAAYTAYLLGVMDGVKTGPRRIRAGLPPQVRFAHKTGTQRARICDSGVITVPRPGPDQRIVVAACVRGEPSLDRSERVLRQVGEAICASGLLTHGKLHDPSCRSLPSVLPGPGADER